ncbi:hypothetical protein BH24GEM3_BH24GEM3_20260 [soil metagenome]|jgi:hypothetical protein|nr:hypothetical protein [Gemmatimonadota bacterium]MDQ3606326.1 hypothetical protein [Gemmatimonadota bacterium]
MRPASSLVRSIALAPLLALAATACGNGGGTGPARLTTEEVGGSYQICSMTFVPTGNFAQPVDILALVEPDFSRLELSSTQNQFNLLYRLRSGGLSQTAPGTYTLGTNTVDLQFSNSVAVSSLLLPTNRRVTFEFQDNPKRLTPAANPGTYLVAKTDYERLAGSDPNLRDQIEGTFSASFTTGSCS